MNEATKNIVVDVAEISAVIAAAGAFGLGAVAATASRKTIIGQAFFGSLGFVGAFIASAAVAKVTGEYVNNSLLPFVSSSETTQETEEVIA